MSDNINRPQKNKLVSGLFWKFSERILAQIISFIVSIVLSRLLLPDEFGIVALMMVFINIANVFVTSGFGTALVQNKQANDTDYSTIFFCSLGMSLIIYACLFLAAPLIADFYRIPELTLVLRVISLTILLSSVSTVQHAYVQRNMIFRKFFFSTLIGTIISGVVGIIMALNGFGVWALVAQSFTNTIVDTAVLFVTVPWRPKLVFSRTSAGKMLGFGWKVLAADLFGTFFDQLQSLIVGRVYTSADLAYYNKGKNLPDLISVNISATVMTVLFPAISNVNDEKEKVKLMTRSSIKMMAFVMFPLLFGLAAVAKPLVIVLFSDVWKDSIPFVQILSVAAVINLIGNVSLQTMKATGRSGLLLKLEFIKKPVYLALLIIGIRISVLAVAITRLIYALYSSLINAAQMKGMIDYNYIEQLSDIFFPLFLSLLMIAAIYPITLLNVNNILILILQVICGAAIYIGVSAAKKEPPFLALLSILKRGGNKEEQ